MKGKNFLTGSFLSKETAAQSPVVAQTSPSRAEVLVMAENLGVQPKGLGPVTPKRRKSLRERRKLSRRDVLALFDRLIAIPRARHDIFKPSEEQAYRDLCAGNAALAEIAERYRLTESGFTVLLEALEEEVIREALHWKLLDRDEIGAGQTYDSIEEETEATQNRDVAKSGGGSIGGRIITREASTAPGNTFRNRKLDSFERGGRLRMTGKSSGDPNDDLMEQQHGCIEDDYSESSGA